jgi:hypothetical protein
MISDTETGVEQNGKVSTHTLVDTYGGKNPMKSIGEPHWDGEAPVTDTAGVSKTATKDRSASNCGPWRAARGKRC